MQWVVSFNVLATVIAWIRLFVANEGGVTQQVKEKEAKSEKR
jgi:hypothetical protein